MDLKFLVLERDILNICKVGRYMKKILVTGGAGFIGLNIAKILSDNIENEVHIVGNLYKGKKDDVFEELIEKTNVIFYKIDLTDLNNYSKIENDYDQIYHLAAIVGVTLPFSWPPQGRLVLHER